MSSHNAYLYARACNVLYLDAFSDAHMHNIYCRDEASCDIGDMEAILSDRVRYGCPHLPSVSSVLTTSARLN